jgi:hypothetical protein
MVHSSGMRWRYLNRFSALVLAVGCGSSTQGGGVAQPDGGALDGGTPSSGADASASGMTIYDSESGVTWLADANLPATNRFGIPVCTASRAEPCINASGSMGYKSAVAWVSAMNAAAYLGHTTWQLPTSPKTDTGCTKTGPNGNSFGFACAKNAMGALYYQVLGIKAPNTAVPIPKNTASPFANFQPYLYWSGTSAGGNGYSSLSFNSGFQGANTEYNFLYVLPMLPGKIPGAPAGTGKGLQVNPDGKSVYDPVANVTWLADANLAATNTFGLPPCTAVDAPNAETGLRDRSAPFLSSYEGDRITWRSR